MGACSSDSLNHITALPRFLDFLSVFNSTRTYKNDLGERLNSIKMDFPGSPVVKTSPSNTRDAGLISGQ